MTIDTGVAKLPGLPVVKVDDQGMQRWMQAVAERLEVREGQRGNAKERAVTVRDLENALKNLQSESSTEVMPNGDLKIKIGGLTAAISVDAFAESIRKTRLYRDLMKRLDDQSRFDDLPSEIRDVLLRSIAEEAAARGADIRRVETKIQDANRSLAMVTEELTASLGNNAAGIREVQAAYVNSSQATAVKVTQLESSLGNYYQDGTPGRVQLEEQLTTQASFVDGLRGQYTLKIQAGGALAGFGLAAEEVNGVPSSAFLIAADKFAIVSPDYSGGLTTTPATNNIPFGVDASGVYINGQVRINATGLQLQQVSRSIVLTAPTNVFKQNASGAWDGSTITITANKLGGLTATPAWTVVSGTYGGSLPSGNALTVSRTSMSTDVVVFRATATQDGFNYTDDFTVARLVDGSNAITALLSNEAHSVSADASGNVSSYTGSGTEIRVFEGGAALNYDGSGASNGTWTVTASGSSITPGSISDSGSYATVGNHANFLTASDTATITYTISGKTSGGTSFSLTKTQSFSKAKTGSQGATGAAGAAGVRGSQTFYATGSVWSDTTANNIVTTVTGSSTKVIGDTVVISNGSSFSQTRYWGGSAWVSPGVVIDGNLLVNGTISGSKIGANEITADKIDSRSLTIKDAAGNILFGASNNLDISRVANKGAFATLNQITAANISTYMASAAIGSAYIGNAAITNAKIGDLQVDTIKIAGNAVTFSNGMSGSAYGGAFSISCNVTSFMFIVAETQGGYQTSNLLDVKVDGNRVIYFQGDEYFDGATQGTKWSSKVTTALFVIGAGAHTVAAYNNSGIPYRVNAQIFQR